MDFRAEAVLMIRMCLVVGVLALTGCEALSPEYKLKSEAHKAVTALLRDPESADFDDSTLQIYAAAGLVCDGKVNARNGYGGYTGFQNYVYSRAGGVAFENDDSTLYIQLLTKCTAEVVKETERLTRQMAASPSKGDGRK
ncbi:hypothetical protein GTZ99_12330 [Novosphingobium sp. FSY-8]|uniref:Lipoprotein n=1 Tax=Novosphingobium ovatum TaxID=1908523 RepID=A0ABW9XFY3_9SPHN|nr:hypothetical protein [Novosphingobium ovatum]NBC37337.1 hypothetical protein [Novosphingobium ovatum]